MTIPANSAKTQKLPAAARPVFNDITAITRAFCTQHLDAEYAPAVRQAGRQAGPQAPIPAAARRPAHLGRRHRLCDRPGQLPRRPRSAAPPTHRRAGQPARRQADHHGQQGPLIMDTLRIGLLDPQYCRRDLLDRNPLVDAGGRWPPRRCTLVARGGAGPGMAARADPVRACSSRRRRSAAPSTASS